MREALLTICGMQGSMDNGDDIELVTTGEYEWTPERTVFSYLETELTGLAGTKTEFLVEGRQVTLTRTGTMAMQMIFRVGQKHYFFYNTPFGSMNMGIQTLSVHNELGELGGNLEVRYMMDFRSSMVTRNHLKVNIRVSPQTNEKGEEGNERSD